MLITRKRTAKVQLTRAREYITVYIESPLFRGRRIAQVLFFAAVCRLVNVVSVNVYGPRRSK